MGEEEKGPEDEEEDEEWPEVSLTKTCGGDWTTRGTGTLKLGGRRTTCPSGKGW
jgi:hypothetical protein